jgi:hypothetical protein
MNTIKLAATNKRRGNAGKLIFLKNLKKSKKNCKCIIWLCVQKYLHKVRSLLEKRRSTIRGSLMKSRRKTNFKFPVVADLVGKGASDSRYDR